MQVDNIKFLSLALEEDVVSILIEFEDESHFVANPMIPEDGYIRYVREDGQLDEQIVFEMID